MIRHFCDRCGKGITEEQPNIYKVTIDTDYSLFYDTVVELCKDCVDKLRKWLKATEQDGSVYTGPYRKE